jgi:hypothetical protein
MAREINQVIDQLSKIESSSRDIISGAEAQKKAYAHQIEEQTKEFDTALAGETADKLEKHKERLRKQAEQDLAALREATDKQLLAFNTWYESNHARLAQDILNQIVG